MSILNYELHLGVSSPQDFLLKLKEFCFSQGWTIDVYENDRGWQNGTGFISGGGSGQDYLFVSSSGHGSQNLIFRMATRKVIANSNFVEIGGFLDTTYATNTATKPHLQTDKWNANTLAIGLPDGANLKTWFFGNEKAIHAVNQIENDYVEHMYFGSVELFDTTDTQGYFCGYTRTATTTEWFDKTAHPPYDRTDRNIYHGSAVKAALDSGVNFVCNSSSVVNDKFYSYKDILSTNPWSSIRPLQKQIYFVEDLTDGVWFPLGQTFCYRLDVTGLNIGQSYFFGAEEYLVFPFGRATEQYGVAFKVS